MQQAMLGEISDLAVAAATGSDSRQRAELYTSGLNSTSKYQWTIQDLDYMARHGVDAAIRYESQMVLQVRRKECVKKKTRKHSVDYEKAA